MPWQRQVADVGCELLEDGLPAYREVIVTVPRQSGKTTLFVSWQIDRCLNWVGGPQRSAFTAQTGKDARDKWKDELFPLIEGSALSPLVQQIDKGMGNESITWRTGGLIRLLSSSASSGHSKTIHQAVLDEIWHDVDDRREQGLRPAMITIADAQLLVCSTAGTAASTVYNRKRLAGRQAVQNDIGQGIAYFEWSAPDDWDPEDEDSWWGFMPALGYTVTPGAVRSELESMKREEFIRAYGNVPTKGADMVFPPEVWERVVDARAQAQGPVGIGVDVAEDRGSAAIAIAGSNDVVELYECQPGTGWVAKDANELRAANRGSQVALDFGGPAGSEAARIVDCHRPTGREVVQACAQLFDDIVENRVRFRADPFFDEAVEGVAKRPVGDGFVWSRKDSVADVTPLMAATMARYALTQEGVPQVAPMVRGR